MMIFINLYYLKIKLSNSLKDLGRHNK